MLWHAGAPSWAGTSFAGVAFGCACWRDMYPRSGTTCNTGALRGPERRRYAAMPMPFLCAPHDSCFQWNCFLFGPVSNRQVQSYFHHHLHCLQTIPSPQLVFTRRRLGCETVIDTSASQSHQELPGQVLAPTAAYAQIPSAGLHVMEVLPNRCKRHENLLTLSIQWHMTHCKLDMVQGKFSRNVLTKVPSMANSVEMVSGLAPAVHCFLVWTGKKLRPMQAAHPFVPTIHVSVQDTSAFFVSVKLIRRSKIVNKTGLYVLFRQDPTQLKLEADEPSSGRIWSCVQTPQLTWNVDSDLQFTKIKSFQLIKKNHVIIYNPNPWRFDTSSLEVTVELMDVPGALEEIFVTIQGALHGAPTKVSSSGGFGIQGYPEMIWKYMKWFNFSLVWWKWYENWFVEASLLGATDFSASELQSRL